MEAFYDWDAASAEGAGGILLADFQRLAANVGMTATQELAKAWPHRGGGRGFGKVAYTELLDALDLSKALTKNMASSKPLRTALYQMATQRIISVMTCWDTDGNGSISRYEFAKAMAVLGITASREEFAGLFSQLDVDGSGDIDWKEIVGACNALSAPGGTDELQRQAGSKPQHELKRRRKKKCLDKSRPLIGQINDSLVEEFKSVLAAFHEWDADASNTISFEEFMQAMASLGLRSTGKVEALWRVFDKDGNGELTYDELLESLGHSKLVLAPHSYASSEVPSGAIAGMRVRQTGEMRSVAAQVNDAFEEIATDRVLDIFRAWDSDGSGALSPYEFGKALAALGVRASKADVQKFYRSMESDGSGKLEYAELYHGIKKMRYRQAAGSQDFT